MATKIKWDDAEKDLVRSMWTSGQTAQSISDALGGKFSKNAVVGCAHRIGLANHGKPRPPRPKSIKPVKEPTPIKFRPDHVPTEKPVSVLPPDTYASYKQCQYMDGDPRISGWQMCGHPVKEGYSFCPYHHSRVYDQERTTRAAGALKKL